MIVKERLQGESVCMLLLCMHFESFGFQCLLQVIFDIKKAAVGVRYRVVVDDYGIRQLIPIDVPVYKEVSLF